MCWNCYARTRMNGNMSHVFVQVFYRFRSFGLADNTTFAVLAILTTGYRVKHFQRTYGLSLTRLWTVNENDITNSISNSSMLRKTFNALCVYGRVVNDLGRRRTRKTTTAPRPCCTRTSAKNTNVHDTREPRRQKRT